MVKKERRERESNVDGSEAARERSRGYDTAEAGKRADADHHHTCSCELEDDASTLSRRNFLKLGMGVLGVVAALEAGGASLLYLRSHSAQGEFGDVIKAGAVEEFPPGSVTEFAESRFFLVRADDGGFLAVHSRCPHLGCSVVWVPEEEQFLCPCHASKFDIHGDHGDPPVSRALDLFAVTIEKGVVKVDTAEMNQRTQFAPEQLVYA